MPPAPPPYVQSTFWLRRPPSSRHISQPRRVVSICVRDRAGAKQLLPWGRPCFLLTATRGVQMVSSMLCQVYHGVAPWRYWAAGHFFLLLFWLVSLTWQGCGCLPFFFFFSLLPFSSIFIHGPKSCAPINLNVINVMVCS